MSTTTDWIGDEAIVRGLASTFDFSHWADLRVPTADTVVKQPPQSVGFMERVAAFFGLLVFAPLMGAIAVAIKLDSPGGPVFYRQERVGLNRRRRSAGDSPTGEERRRTPGFGRPFGLWKFRTMIPQAEQRTGPVWASKNDPRITRVGLVLRKLRLDEIPQLINVVRGDMRLIGPRPERPHFVEQLCEVIPQYAERLRVPPGITGLAQVERAYDSSVDDVRIKLLYDLFYVANWSPVLDLKIILKTVDVALCRKGAH